MTLQKVDEGIYIQDTVIEAIDKIDSVIFDCDGVLVDVTNSYDLTIQRVVKYMLSEVADIQSSFKIMPEIIAKFKATGGFNDEVDTSYVLILSLIAAIRLNVPQEEFINKVVENADETGIKSVERYLSKLSIDLSDIIKKLDYPGQRNSNLLYSVFDQMFYGQKLYYKLFKKKSRFNGHGLIENDKVLLTKDLIKTLKKKYDNKVAIVSGRGIESIRFTLKELLDEFDIKNSVFLEDEPRDLAKPNPESLLKAIKGLGSTNPLYVGDSTEDFIMSNKTNEIGFNTIFCGIFGTSASPDTKRKLFEGKNIPIMLQSIRLLPKALNLV